MTQIATVEALRPDGRAEIVVTRQSACAHDCRDCAGCGAGGAVVRAVADNPLGAQSGQRVVVESSSRRFFGAVLLVYTLPVALFFLAYALTASRGDAVSATASILAFFFGILPAIRYDRSLQRSGVTFTIVRVL